MVAGFIDGNQVHLVADRRCAFDQASKLRFLSPDWAVALSGDEGPTLWIVCKGTAILNRDFPTERWSIDMLVDCFKEAAVEVYQKFPRPPEDPSVSSFLFVSRTEMHKIRFRIYLRGVIQGKLESRAPGDGLGALVLAGGSGGHWWLKRYAKLENASMELKVSRSMLYTPTKDTFCGDGMDWLTFAPGDYPDECCRRICQQLEDDFDKDWGFYCWREGHEQIEIFPESEETLTTSQVAEMKKITELSKLTWEQLLMMYKGYWSNATDDWKSSRKRKRPVSM